MCSRLLAAFPLGVAFTPDDVAAGIVCGCSWVGFGCGKKNVAGLLKGTLDEEMRHLHGDWRVLQVLEAKYGEVLLSQGQICWGSISDLMMSEATQSLRHPHFDWSTPPMPEPIFDFHNDEIRVEFLPLCEAYDYFNTCE